LRCVHRNPGYSAFVDNSPLDRDGDLADIDSPENGSTPLPTLARSWGELFTQDEMGSQRSENCDDFRVNDSNFAEWLRGQPLGNFKALTFHPR
jgi:hypothetical protein